MRKIKVWAVVKTDKDINKMKECIYTIVKNKEQADEYILRRFYVEYYSPFTYWCEIHDKDNKDIETFKSFMFTRYDKEELNKYSVIPITYTLDHLCALIRILSEFNPIGTSYESTLEIEQFLAKHTKENNAKL